MLGRALDTRGSTVPTMVTPAGTVYEGYVSALDGSFFSLTLPGGKLVGFYVDDPGIRLEAL